MLFPSYPVQQMAALQSPFYDEQLNLYALVKKIEKCAYPALDSDSSSESLRSLVASCVIISVDARPTAEQVRQIAEQQHATCSGLSGPNVLNLD